MNPNEDYLANDTIKLKEKDIDHKRMEDFEVAKKQQATLPLDSLQIQSESEIIRIEQPDNISSMKFNVNIF